MNDVWTLKAFVSGAACFFPVAERSDGPLNWDERASGGSGNSEKPPSDGEGFGRKTWKSRDSIHVILKDNCC